jgi:hypothetical protein
MATAKKRKKTATKKAVVHHRKPHVVMSTPRRRKKKIGSTPSESLIFGVLGGIAGKMIAKNLSGTTLGLPTSIVPFIVPAAGAAMVFMSKDQKIKDAGAGMVIVGAADLVNGYIPALIKGIQAPQTVGMNYNQNKRVGYNNYNRLPPQTVGRNRTLRLNGVNPTSGSAGNRGSNLPMTIGNLYGSF